MTGNDPFFERLMAEQKKYISLRQDNIEKSHDVHDGRIKENSDRIAEVCIRVTRLETGHSSHADSIKTSAGDIAALIEQRGESPGW
ncbi:MAG: hypothetical protein ABW189_01550 [Rickettsiales bacterium]